MLDNARIDSQSPRHLMQRIAIYVRSTGSWSLCMSKEFETHGLDSSPWNTLSDKNEATADDEDEQEDRASGICQDHIGADASEHAEHAGLHEDGAD